jgi:flagellar protein FliL
MSETATPTPTSETDSATPKKKKSNLLFIIIGFVLLLGGAGGGFYYWRIASASAASTEEGGEKKAKGKKEAKSSDEEEDAPEKTSAKMSKSAKKSLDAALPDDENVKTVIELQPFIVNLADENQERYLRMTVSVGIGGEGGEEKPEPLFVTRIRNALIAVLTLKKSEEVLTIEGKTKLRKELLKAAQAASEEPHVEAIYITDFIVQL